MRTSILNILIAEDDLDDLELIQAALSNSSCDTKVTAARDGEELVMLLDELPFPNAIVLDLNMPKRNGRECLKAIRSNADYKDIPIVILSTSSSANDKSFCMQHGANLYLEKPNSLNGMKLIAEQICSTAN
jgi:CheY-like chemotaxis protein